VAEPITRNAYAILGVAPDCNDRAIVVAYRAMARRFHPDVAGETATEWMIRLNEAFERVRTPDRRAEYDLELERSGFPGARRTSRGGPPAPDAGTARQAAPAAASAGWPQERDGTGGAGPPPGRPSGSVLGFGRHTGWSIGEIARVDPGYLIWLEDRREGRPYLEEIDQILRSTGRRAASAPPPDRAGRRRR
jgi:curved DNA-binding protein CbpA